MVHVPRRLFTGGLAKRLVRQGGALPSDKGSASSTSKLGCIKDLDLTTIKEVVLLSTLRTEVSIKKHENVRY